MLLKKEPFYWEYLKPHELLPRDLLEYFLLWLEIPALNAFFQTNKSFSRYFGNNKYWSKRLYQETEHYLEFYKRPMLKYAHQLIRKGIITPIINRLIRPIMYSFDENIKEAHKIRHLDTFRNNIKNPLSNKNYIFLACATGNFCHFHIMKEQKIDLSNYVETVISYRNCAMTVSLSHDLPVDKYPWRCLTYRPYVLRKYAVKRILEQKGCVPEKEMNRLLQEAVRRSDSSFYRLLIQKFSISMYGLLIKTRWKTMQVEIIATAKDRILALQRLLGKRKKNQYPHLETFYSETIDLLQNT